MSPRPLDPWRPDPTLPVFRPERPDPDLAYVGLRCACGGDGFRVSGRPRVASGGGGLFWRTLTRVFREARLPMVDGEPGESPFALPLALECTECGQQAPILEGIARAAGLADGSAGTSVPREALRCRACRRSRFALAVGRTDVEPPHESTQGVGHRTDAVEVVALCLACRRQARIAWNEDRPSDQEIRLDHLYGRR